MPIVEGLLKACCCHLVTWVKGVSGDAPSQLHLRVGPGDDVSTEVAATGGQAVDVAGRQHMRPHVQVRHLAHKRLGGVEATPEGVLEESRPRSALVKKVISCKTGWTLCGRVLLPAPGPGWRPLRVWWAARGRDSSRTPAARRHGRPPTVRPWWTRSRTHGATSHRWQTAAASRPVGGTGKAGRWV